MTKSDLKDGMVVETRLGMKYMWLNGMAKGLYGSLACVNEDLTNEVTNDCDIVKVMKQADGAILKYAIEDASEVIWEREKEEKDIDPTWKCYVQILDYHGEVQHQKELTPLKDAEDETEGIYKEFVKKRRELGDTMPYSARIVKRLEE